MEKYYFKTTGQEPDVDCTEMCLCKDRPSENTRIGSGMCQDCKNCYGWDSDEYWIKCMRINEATGKNNDNVGENIKFENSITLKLGKGICEVVKSKKQLPIIDVQANGKPDWYTGAYTLVFVYSRNKGNFILRGYRGEVMEYLKKNYTHYFCYISMWHNGSQRGHWHFWKDNVMIFEPSKSSKTWKYKIRTYADDEKKELVFKRFPRRWIPEFNQL